MPPHTSPDTPVMRQYFEIKQRYSDCILFFRLGDFYEMFFEDAQICSKLLDLTLTSRDKSKEDGVPMCGVPHHAAKDYISKLIEFGKKVAICDQVEDARLAKKIVRREVTQVITPGVVLDEGQLQPRVSHYLLALCRGSTNQNTQVGLGALDVSTGEFLATQMSASEALEEACRLEPREVLLIENSEGEKDPSWHDRVSSRLRVPIGTSPLCDIEADKEVLSGVLGEQMANLRVPEVEGPAGSLWPLALSAAAACVHYAKATQPQGTLPITRLSLYRPSDSLTIDEATKVNLELFQTSMERKRQGSLLSIVDHTKTAMGGRLLRRWLGSPLRSQQAIRGRLDAVEWLYERPEVRKALREHLSEIHDIERLTGRLTLEVATPRDLASLASSLFLLPKIDALLRSARKDASAVHSESLGLAIPELVLLGDDLLQEVPTQIASALIESPPAAYREGGFIRPGYHEELDRLSEISKGGKNVILQIEERERERSGIASLKIRYNKISGYCFEITKSNLSKVPAHFIRKQTLSNAERYVTAELTEYESQVLTAEERRLELELSLFESLKKALQPAAPSLMAIAGRLAALDAVASLAEVAHRNGYVRPEIAEGLRLHIEDGRHPVVEQLAAPGTFVPNDVTIDPDDGQILLITGPNMAGKSTIMRQVALITVMAQMGSFVPAKKAQVGLVDRVFTRVGAADNLARGESTFMVEMRETASILQYATKRSLVILDEIGRGTSTYDGVSIAWAVAEYLHDVIGAKTLFATHYHELCALSESHKRVRNFSISVREWQGEIIFVHRLVEGGASRSYGIEVARLAGLPKVVLERARQVLAVLETTDSGDSARGPVHGPPRLSNQQLALFEMVGRPTPPLGTKESSRGKVPKTAVHTTPATSTPPVVPAILKRLEELDCDGMTPRDALALLAEWKNVLKG